MDIMKSRIKQMSLSYDGTIREALQSIDMGALGLALLVDLRTEKFCGLVTDGDIRRALLKGSGLESPVASVSRPEPKTAHVGMSPEQVAALFSEPVRVVPLLDDDGQVVDLAIFDRRMRLPVAEPSLGEKELLYVSECVLTGWVSSAGKFVTRFETAFADFCGTRYAVATSNGTTALHLALLALDIGPGDEVIVPTFTFIATANAVTYTGARSVFVDSDPETWNIDPNLIEAAITPRTKALIPVHLYGHPADMDPILDIAARHNLAVIEDAAEAHGAHYKGRRVGNIGDISIFSFYGNKIITTGEGGMVVTNRADLAEKVHMLRDHGMSKERRYWHPVLGYNYRMTNLQAALGVAQMERIETILANKLKVAAMYKHNLQDLKGVTLPPNADWAENVFWLYTVLIDEQEFDMSRDEIMASLKLAGVDSRPTFPPVHQQPIYDTGQTFPIAEQLGKTGLSLPSLPNLQEIEVARVAQKLRDLHN